MPGIAFKLEQAGHSSYTYPKLNRRARHTKKSNKSKEERWSL